MLDGESLSFINEDPASKLKSSDATYKWVYTQRHNRLNKTDGPLLRGRYKAILVDSDAYLLHLSKYIHLNPLSAGIVDCLIEYKWSSYAAYIDKPWYAQVMRRFLYCSYLYGRVTKQP